VTLVRTDENPKGGKVLSGFWAIIREANTDRDVGWGGVSPQYEKACY